MPHATVLSRMLVGLALFSGLGWPLSARGQELPELAGEPAPAVTAPIPETPGIAAPTPHPAAPAPHHSPPAPAPLRVSPDPEPGLQDTLPTTAVALVAAAVVVTGWCAVLGAGASALAGLAWMAAATSGTNPAQYLADAGDASTSQPFWLLLVAVPAGVPLALATLSLLSVAGLEHLSWSSVLGERARSRRRWPAMLAGAAVAPAVALGSLVLVAPLHGLAGLLWWARFDEMSPFQHGLPPDQRRWDFWTRNPLHRWKSVPDAAVFSLGLTVPFMVPAVVLALAAGWAAGLVARDGAHEALDAAAAKQAAAASSQPQPNAGVTP